MASSGVPTEAVSIDIVESLTGQLENLKNVGTSLLRSQCCIHRVHERFREINKHAYTPMKVSIGPFHNGKGNLQKMEVCKQRYAYALLTRTTNVDYSTKLVECVEAVRMIEQEARNCYSEQFNLKSDAFVGMMVVDGLFIIELFRREIREVITNEDGPLINNKHDVKTLVCDLVMLENQLPMLVLECLFNLPTLREDLQGTPNINLTMLALKFFNYLMPRGENVLVMLSNSKGKHLLDLLGNTFVESTTGVRTERKEEFCKYITSATELEIIGMKFKKHSTKHTLVDVTCTSGLLEFPPVTIKHDTDFLLANLIAFEEHSAGHVNHMTSYALLMYKLLITGKDVGVLRHQGIITNYSDRDEEVCDFFKKLAREVTCSNFCYSTLCDQVELYCNSHWRVWRKITRHKIFGDGLTLSVALLSCVIAYVTFFKEHH